MRKLKCLLATLALVAVVSATALAGETNAPPGETNGPPGEQNGPPAANGSMLFNLGIYLSIAS